MSPVLRSGALARKKPVKYEDLGVGDLIEIKPDPAGPGTEEYRRTHGIAVDVRVTNINKLYDDGSFTVDVAYFVEDLESLFEWITLMDGMNSGEFQVRTWQHLTDVDSHCIETILEKYDGSTGRLSWEPTNTR